MPRFPSVLTAAETKELDRLSTPRKIQEYLDALPINFEEEGETCMSPRRVLRERRAHCIEGALLAAAALWRAGAKPLLLDLKTVRGDDEHVVTLYRLNGHWGAISKTNHAVLRYRDPVYRTVRELALSYFHEYFKGDTGAKTLRSYSRPFDLSRLGHQWMIDEGDLWHVARALDASPHLPLVPKETVQHLKRASSFERTVMDATEWQRP